MMQFLEGLSSSVVRHMSIDKRTKHPVGKMTSVSCPETKHHKTDKHKTLMHSTSCSQDTDVGDLNSKSSNPQKK